MKLAVLYIYLVVSSDALFASSLSNVVVSLPQIPAPVMNEMKKNGLHAEIVGRFAPPRTECGVVLLDYSGFTSGAVFESVAKHLQNTLQELVTANPAIQTKGWDAELNATLEAHTKEMRELFGNYSQYTSILSNDENGLEFFPLLAFGMLIGATLAVYGLNRVGGWFTNYLQDTAGDAEEMKKHAADQLRVLPLMRNHNVMDGSLASKVISEAYHLYTLGLTKPRINTNLLQYEVYRLVELINQQNERLTNLTLTEIYSSRFSTVLSQARQAIYTDVVQAMDGLFIQNRVDKKLVVNTAGPGLWSSIKILFGAGRWEKSLLAKGGIRGSDAIEATVIAMNMRLMEVKVCYPSVGTDEVVPLLHVEPLGDFNKDSNTYSYPKLHKFHALPSTCVSIDCMVPVLFEDCTKHIGDVALCATTPPDIGCPLAIDSRTSCLVEEMSIGSAFVNARTLLTTTVVATNMDSATFTTSQGKHSSLAVQSPIFVVALPTGSYMTVGGLTIPSRIATTLLTEAIDFHPSSPAMPPLTPFVPENVALFMKQPGGYMMTSNILLLNVLMAAVIGLIIKFWMIYTDFVKHQRELNALVQGFQNAAH